MNAMHVSAWSQMWVFAFYELFRTWRQKAREVRDYAASLQSSSDPAKTASDFRASFEKSTAVSRTAEVFEWPLFEEAERAPEATVGLIARALEIVDPLYRRLEAVRMTLAKHEVPKARGVRASAPGYGRIDLSSGSINWMIDYKDGSSEIISRRDLAEEFESLAELLPSSDSN